MSIIERVAELLGSIPQTHHKPVTGSDGANIHEPDLIQRAAGEFGRQPGFPGETDLTADSRVKDRATRPTSRTARTFKVDRDRLRRQSMLTPDGERTPVAESFRRIKRQILANVASPKFSTPSANLVLVTSALTGEGKSYCAINLAISIALEMDRTVLLVDADVAKPSIPQALGLKVERGLMDVLLDRRIDLGEVLWKADIGKLTIMPVGTAHMHATELLASGAMRALLHEIAVRYHDRVVIFDSPPLLAASEASVLASQVGQIVVVVEAGRTSEAALKDALSRVDSSKVTGLLLNKGEISGLGHGYGYGGYG
jgi:protein-tyrosine kinase